MKAEVIREIARKGARHEGEYMNAFAIIDMALPILEKAGFVVLPKEELEAALKPFADEADEWHDSVPDSHRSLCTEPGSKTPHFGSETKFTIGDLRRAAALLAAITQEKKS